MSWMQVSFFCPVFFFALSWRVTVYFQMVAKGKDASELFPAVVKNVVSKNIEVNLINHLEQPCGT